MGLEPEVTAAFELAQALQARGRVLTNAAWEIERVLHNLRLNAVGASGIQHRVILDRGELLEQLQVVVEDATRL